MFWFSPFLRNSTRVWPTDGPTDGPTDTPSYGDARTHLKTSSSRKMIFLEDDVFHYAKFFTVIHINSFQYEKYVFLELTILWNFLFNLCKKLGFWIFLLENFTACSSNIVLCILSVRAFPIRFLTIRKINNGLQSTLTKK